MKKNTTRRALLLSALSLFLCVSMLVGSTFAWFTDSVTSGRNTILSGNLDMELEYSTDLSLWSTVDSDTELFDDETLWEPGHTEVVYLRVSNQGSLAFKYDLMMNVASETAGVNQEGESFLLSDYLVYGVKEDVAAPYADRETARDDVSMAGLIVPYSAPDALEAKDSAASEYPADVFALVVFMPESVGNEANHNGVSLPEIRLGVTVVATQNVSESDSFGTDYDADATYPAIASVVYDDPTTAKEIEAGEVAVTLPAAAPTGTYELVVSNENAETDAAGKTSLAFDIELKKDGVKVQPDGVTEYEVQIKVGAGLDIHEVLHNGVAITEFTYDPNGEFVSFSTSSFSPFAVVYTPFPQGARFAKNGVELQNLLWEIKAEQAEDENATAYIALTGDILFDASSEFMFTESNGGHLYFYHVNVTLDLNGHDIKATADALKEGKTSANGLMLVRYSTLNIVGEGNVIAENKSIAVYNWAHSTVNIYGGNYVSNAYLRTESAIYVNNTSSKTNVYGGTYTNTPFAFNTHNTSCTDVVITLHDGIVFNDYANHAKADYQGGRIALAEGCAFESTVVDGVTVYSVVKA